MFFGFSRACPDANGRQVHAFETTTKLANGTTAIGTYCPGIVAPPVVVTANTVRASVVKALPAPVIGSAPPAQGLPLVNVQVITWVKTADGELSLGSARLLGHDVDFRGKVQTVAWNFGDGSTANSEGPGRAYDFDANPCQDYLCPGYFGHVYRTRGGVTITARATWFAQFRVDGGDWIDVGNVQGTVGQLRLTIHSAKTVLVNR